MLIWKFKDIEILIAHAVQSKDHCRTFAQHCEGVENPPAALHLVKDSGVYLMSNGIPNLPRTAGAPGSKVAYAKGLNPDIDGSEEVWEAARDEVGGDDFCENITIDFLLTSLKFGKKDLLIDFNETSFGLKVRGKRTDAIRLPKDFSFSSLPGSEPDPDPEVEEEADPTEAAMEEVMGIK